MGAPPPKSGACECGQVVFDLTARRSGEVLNCSWCSRAYRYMGGERIAPLSSEEAKLAEAAAKQVRGRTGQRRSGPPGGILPMIGFIVAGNALAFVALAVLLPRGPELRHTLWESDFTIQSKAVWPDLCALGAGRLDYSGAWRSYL